MGDIPETRSAMSSSKDDSLSSQESPMKLKQSRGSLGIIYKFNPNNSLSNQDDNYYLTDNQPEHNHSHNIEHH